MLAVQDEDGSRRKVPTITSNEDHVGNLIAEGHAAEADRYQLLARAYKGQAKALRRELLGYSERVEARYYATIWQRMYLEYMN